MFETGRPGMFETGRPGVGQHCGWTSAGDKHVLPDAIDRTTLAWDQHGNAQQPMMATWGRWSDNRDAKINVRNAYENINPNMQQINLCNCLYVGPTNDDTVTNLPDPEIILKCTYQTKRLAR